MIEVKLSNCNNILSGIIQLNKNKLNIRYAMNGTGKSTIASAIDCISNGKDISVLKPFDADDEPLCNLSEAVNVLVFNEDFVNNVVFQQNEVIQNSFEVFIKTPEYEKSLKSIEERLKNIRVDVANNADLQKILLVGKAVLSKFFITTTGDLKRQGLMKSLTNSENIFELPEKLSKFKPLMQKEYKVDWVGWKNDGSKYDDNGICPFCSSDLDEEYPSQKKVFTSSYKKSDVKNIIETLSYFDTVIDYMDTAKKEKLYQCIREKTDESEIQFWVKRFYDELNFLVAKMTKVVEFNSYQVRPEDISSLDKKLNELIIDITDLEIFSNQKVKDLSKFINQRVQAVLKETESLKADIGQLKNIVGTAKKSAIKDINDFLSTAGINYEFEILDESENSSKTILKYISKTKEPVEVDDIPLHLSWGERNAFALVLFMHHALSHNPDIIILDDPISSFDSSKKYAIIHRLFSSDRKKSLYKKTVLMLTHDLEPIIDCLVNNKPDREVVSACFLQNKDGVIHEKAISRSDIKSMPTLLRDNSKNEKLNKVHRVASLRKLIELTPDITAAHNSAYGLLSCLVHGKTKPTTQEEIDLTPGEIKSGENLVKAYIADFSFANYSKDVFSKDSLIKSFKEEKEPYIRLQIFRVLLSVLEMRKQIENPLLKYIDEQFHVENDYMFNLDFTKYDIVPDFFIAKCIEFLDKKDLI